MAKSSALAALLAVVLVVASLCVACNAARIVPEHGRELIVADDVGDIGGFVGDEAQAAVTLVMDLTRINGTKPGNVSTTASGTSTQSGQTSCKLVPGQVTELQLVQVVVQDLGVVHLLLDFLGVRTVIALDLTRLVLSVVDGAAHLVVVFVLDTTDKILHLQNQLGHCIADLSVLVDVPIQV